MSIATDKNSLRTTIYLISLLMLVGATGFSKIPDNRNQNFWDQIFDRTIDQNYCRNFGPSFSNANYCKDSGSSPIPYLRSLAPHTMISRREHSNKGPHLKEDFLPRLQKMHLNTAVQ